jgi:hypothetical protein
LSAPTQRVSVVSYVESAYKTASYFPKKKGHIINAGFPIWALDFLPQPPYRDLPRPQMLAIAGHPGFDYRPKLYVPESGPNVIQLWALESTDPSFADSTYLATVICHTWGTCWGLKFCPYGASNNGRAGLLAGVFGDGIVRVFDIRNELIGKPGKTVNIEISEPGWEYTFDDTMATCVAWKSHFEIIIGCSNGTGVCDKTNGRICCIVRSQRRYR